jgi:hypothetical protein
MDKGTIPRGFSSWCSIEYGRMRKITSETLGASMGGEPEVTAVDEEPAVAIVDAMVNFEGGV